nr:2886_t:CDS:2 [Entrophospora candida]
MSLNNDLTAKLEKLEQKITLTLQEIDHNFSTCHHRVTTKILPQIMRYGELSEEIFNNSQYWLMFYNQLNSIKPRNSISLSSVTSSTNRDQINNKSSSSPLLLAQPPLSTKLNHLNNQEKFLINNNDPLLLFSQQLQKQRLLNNRDSINSLPSNISLPLINNNISISSTPLSNISLPLTNNNISISSTPLPDPPQFMYRLIQSTLSDASSSPSPSSRI